jgi:preprotein translocase subunit SecD
MKKGLRWKVIITVAVIAGCVIMFTPIGEKIKLGLDLKGGIHLLLQVKTEDAITAETDQEIVRFSELLKKNSITFTAGVKEKPGRFAFTGTDANQEGKIKDLVSQYTRDWTISFLADRVIFNLNAATDQILREQAVAQTLETIRNRIDQFGVSEPLIQKQGTDRVVVELPGVDNPDRVKDLIKVTAVLKWRLVKGGPAADEPTLLAPFNGKIPEDAEIVRGDASRGHPGLYLLEKVAAVSGQDLRSVRRSQDEWNNPAVAFQLNSDGARRFEQITGANINGYLAIVLDDKVQSAPQINARIGDSGIIQGRFTAQEADDLVIILKAGALPAGISYLEERTISASLGSDSVRQGLFAGLVAILAVMIFMLFYYKLSGINAIVALILNVVVLLGALAYFKANLTLPGIAGIILSIGMAVDANVLIFERIKEERATAKSVASSVAAGFSKAFTAIFDSNLTTIISAIFLFQFGTGPIRGYAVTLTISLTANLFTAVFVSRVMFDLVIPKTAKKLSI